MVIYFMKHAKKVRDTQKKVRASIIKNMTRKKYFDTRYFFLRQRI